MSGTNHDINISRWSTGTRTGRVRDIADELTRAKVGPDGRLLVPARMREAMLLGSSGRVTAKVVDGQLTIITPHAALRRVQKMAQRYKNPGESVVDEPGDRDVEPLIDGAIVNAANPAGVIGKMSERGWSDTDISDAIKQSALDVLPPGRAFAVETGFLRRATMRNRLSLGDRACVVGN